MAFENTFRAKRTPLKIMGAVLFALFMREMQTRFGARRLGFFWVVMEPLSILVIILSFHAFLHTVPVQGVDVVMYMVEGIVPFHMFRSIAVRTVDATIANQGLFGYRQVMPFDTFIARGVVEVCVYACAYVLICACLGIWNGRDVLIAEPLQFIWILLQGIVLAQVLGILFAMIAHAVPALLKPCRLAFIVLYVTAGIFFPISVVPQNKLIFMTWNPYVAIVEQLRGAALSGYTMSANLNYDYPLIVTITISFFVMGLYRLRRQYLRTPSV